jgi:2-keto-4-pentenoate hydratase/2-oxohepta-3-ene-1,7-dioic acid hydratase in catechol pathway
MAAMRIATYARGGEDRLALVLDDHVLDLADFARRGGAQFEFLSSMAAFLEAGEESLQAAERLAREARQAGLGRLAEAQPLGQVRLRAPVPCPQKLIALGWNYREHVGEQGGKLPEAPLIFSKFPSAVTGPYDPIVIPRSNPQVDYEVELGVVIGRRGKRIAEAKAYEHVAGYLVFNDVSARAWQFSDKQWTRGKSCDTFAPLGPWLTTKDEIADPHKLAVETRVNGEVRQHSNTSYMVFRIPMLIAHISESITLESGDIIATGTPSGVGVFRKPPVFLQPGDVVEMEIERLGKLRNPVVAEAGD